MNKIISILVATILIFSFSIKTLARRFVSFEEAFAEGIHF